MALINAQSRHLYYYYSTKFRSGVESATVLVVVVRLKMLQAQQRVGVRGNPRTTGSLAVGSRTSDGLMSQSTANRKALLGQSYYEDAKK